MLITYHIQKKKGQALVFSFEYDLLPNLTTDFNSHMDQALNMKKVSVKKVLCYNVLDPLLSHHPFVI